MSPERNGRTDHVEEDLEASEAVQLPVGATNEKGQSSRDMSSHLGADRVTDAEGVPCSSQSTEHVRGTPDGLAISQGETAGGNTIVGEKSSLANSLETAPLPSTTSADVARPLSAAQAEAEAALGLEPPNFSQDDQPHLFVKGRRGRYRAAQSQKLRNNLSFSVGFLEFANALDFAANVWNTIPVPTFAAALMALGGGAALILSVFALKDGILCWRNIRLLKAERVLLLGERHMEDEEMGVDLPAYQSTLDVRLEVNRRELGTEIIDRFSMDAFLGFSAVIVGVGTLLAIAGANPRVYHASNLLSGYIGNSPSAFWGICNSLWSAYLFRRASRHLVIGTKELENEVVIKSLRKRVTAVQTQAVVMGVMTLVSAPGGMITVTRWWGYVMLIPCIFLAIWGNFIWRKFVGYDRSVAKEGHSLWTVDSTIQELEWTISMQKLLKSSKSLTLDQLIAQADPDATMTEFIVRCGLFEDLCERLLSASVLIFEEKEISIDQEMVASCEKSAPEFTDAAQSAVKKKGIIRLKFKERFLLEMLGASLYARAKSASPPAVEVRRASVAAARASISAASAG